jgi:Leucine-rich repeat (LRR) protein
MTTSELYGKLKTAYSTQNLNKITITLINLYQNQQFGTLRQIAEIISESIEINIDPQNKYFSKLMMLYHPDRGDFHRKEIDRLAANDDYKGLLAYSHIIRLDRIEELTTTLTSFEDIDYSPVYEWDFDLDGFNIISDYDAMEIDNKHVRKSKTIGRSFYDAMKIRMYGNTQVGFPPHYLEDLEELELSQSDINDLDGIQYCIHANSIDLSGNFISDISPLWGLTALKELNLADNKLEEIDTLSNLRNLRTLDLSNNAIKDISSLYGLDKLEYLVLTGSRVTGKQIKALEELGITVIY